MRIRFPELEWRWVGEDSVVAAEWAALAEADRRWPAAVVAARVVSAAAVASVVAVVDRAADASVAGEARGDFEAAVV